MDANLNTFKRDRASYVAAEAEAKSEGRDFIPLSQRPAFVQDTTHGGTFNYGRALGVPKPAEEGAPWERRDIGTEYAACEAWSQNLGDVAMTFSAAHWRMAMALREVRNATTPAEQKERHDAAMAAWREVDTQLERIKAGRLTWFRYGRIGDVISRAGR